MNNFLLILKKIANFFGFLTKVEPGMVSSEPKVVLEEKTAPIQKKKARAKKKTITKKKTATKKSSRKKKEDKNGD